jgi:transposase
MSSGRCCPTLRAGNIVVIDNLGSRKGKAVNAAMAAARAGVFLPPYSLELNPIEQIFWVKAALRNAQARTISAAEAPTASDTQDMLQSEMIGGGEYRCARRRNASSPAPPPAVRAADRAAHWYR